MYTKEPAPGERENGYSKKSTLNLGSASNRDEEKRNTDDTD